ncbi:hypothetical protein [Erythrobacter sp. R86502]|uniref:hypothetical protein n=1 Tax=Erythrobacter sp. R86502 TaxID=3093846 RepID=UPI0036D2115B
MMSEDKSSAASSSLPRWVQKILIPASLGGVVGFGASAGMIAYIKGVKGADGIGLDASATIAALVAVLYVLIGLSVGFGAVIPGLGAKFLNVEDADELREQKKTLILSGLAMMLFGVALAALAFAAPDGPLSQGAALAVAMAGLVAGTFLSVLVYRASDELMTAVNLEACAISYGLVFLVFGIWGMLSHLGYTAPPAPLDLVTSFYTLALLATFVAVGRRGMLATR